MKKYLTKTEIKLLSNDGNVFLSNSEIIKKLCEFTIVYDVNTVKIKIIDFRDNILSPEKFAYYITFNNYGKKQKYTYYPNSVGFQG